MTAKKKKDSCGDYDSRPGETDAEFYLRRRAFWRSFEATLRERENVLRAAVNVRREAATLNANP